MALVKSRQAIVEEGELIIFEPDSDNFEQEPDTNIQLSNFVSNLETQFTDPPTQKKQQEGGEDMQHKHGEDERPRKRSKHSELNENWKKFKNLDNNHVRNNHSKQKQWAVSESDKAVEESQGIMQLDEVNRKLSPCTRNIAHSPLHWELMDFCNKCAPRGEEVQNIVDATDIVQQIASTVFGEQAQAMLFGSQAVGLALPGSDLDIVILNVGVSLHKPAQGFDRGEKKLVCKQLWKLFDRLKANNVLEPSFKHQVISGARVPIIKTMLRLANGVKLPADISVGVLNGAEAVTTVTHFIRTVPEVRPLILCIKALLKEQGRNQAFTGGVSSYSVFNLVLVHLMREGLVSGMPGNNGQMQNMLSVQDLLTRISQGLFDVKDYVNDMGELLLGFLRRYGIMMDFKRFGISIVRNKIIKKLPTWEKDIDVVRLAIEDHQEVGKNIGSSSYKILQIQELFKVAYETLRGEVDNLRCGMPISTQLLQKLFHVEVCVSRDEWGHAARTDMEQYVRQRDEEERQKIKQQKQERKQIGWKRQREH